MNAQTHFVDILKYIRHHQDGEVVEKMNRSGILYNMNYGLSYHLLNQKAKSIGRNHELAQMLWKENIRECRLLYMMIEDVTLLSDVEQDAIVQSFANHEIAEIASMHLFVNSQFAINLASQWIQSKREYVKMTGFTLLGRLTLMRKDIESAEFLPFLHDISIIPPVGNLFVKRSICFAYSAIAKYGLKKEVEQLLPEIQNIKTEVADFVYMNVKEELEYL